MKNFILFIFLWIAIPSLGQQHIITGKVTDVQGNIIPSASIYIENTHTGTTANNYGVYKIFVPHGDNKLIYSFIGYERQAQEINISSDTLVNIILNQAPYQLPDMPFTGKKDPARDIMIKVIAARKEHLEEVKTFSMDVYAKSNQRLVKAPKRFFGQDVTKILQLNSTGSGIIYLSESESKVYYKEPDHYHIELTAGQSAGKNGSFSIGKASDLLVNLYRNIIQFDSLSIRGFVSPLADYAFMYYHYKYLGSITENGKIIDKVQVLPRRKSDPVFHGFIYIVEGSWRLHSVDLYLTKASRINFMDTLKIKQQFKPVKNDLWMQSFVEMNFSSNVLGFAFKGDFIGVFNNYELNTDLPDKLFNGEVLKVPKDITRKDSSYWAPKRPVPLTAEEIESFNEKDSLERLLAVKAKKDSLIKQTNRVTFPKVAALGYIWRDASTKRIIRFNPVLPSIFYNTVEGFGFQYNVSFRKEYNLKNWIEITPQVRYGFSNGHFNPRIEGRYYYDPVNRGYLSLIAGNEVLDLTGLKSSVNITNSVNTLIYETNWRKFYERSIVAFSGSYEAAVGFFVKGDLEYSHRRTLENTSDFKIVDRKNKEFTSNNPFTPDQETPLFPRHTAFIMGVEIDYAPGAQYVSRPEGRFYETFKYPRILATYRKGYDNLFDSDVKFSFGSIEVYQNDLRLGLFGKASYTFKAGKFFNNDKLYYPDYYHFQGNNSLIFEQSLRNFHYLDLYRYSADRQFFEAHYEQNFGGFITNKIPLIRKLKLNEIAGGAYLGQPSVKKYYEVFFGLQRLVFRVDYVMSYSLGTKVFQGFKFTYNLR